MRALWRGGRPPSSQPFHSAPKGWLAPLLSGVLIVLLLAAWSVAAPTQFGGLVSYVVVTGNSMDPSLENGDLAIVRAADRYQPGDIVAYRHPNIGPVIHRITAIESDRFVFKGDNNSWTDSYDPMAAELIGALWVQVPRVGALMEATRSAGVLPILGGVGGAILMVSFLGSGDKNQSSRRRRLSVRPIRGRPLGENAQSLLSAIGVGVAGFSLLGVISFWQPPDRTVPTQVGFEQSGRFTYSASVPETALYDPDGVTTGQPVFRQLTSQVDVAFTYRFAAMGASEVSGVQQLLAVVMDTNGWKRTLPLTRETPFEGDKFTVTGVLDLDEIEALTDRLRAETGLRRDQFEVAVVPEILATGMVAGQPFSERFAPRLGFRIDPLQLQMLPPGPREADPRTPSQAGTVEIMQIEPNSLPILGWKLNIADARRLALLGIGLCIAAAAGLGLYLLRDVGGDEPARIEARLGPMLVSIQSEAARDGRVIDVESIDDLAKLAERAGVLVLHESKDTTHQYFVQDGQTAYRYQAFGRRMEAVATATESAGH